MAHGHKGKVSSHSVDRNVHCYGFWFFGCFFGKKKLAIAVKSKNTYIRQPSKSYF